MSGDDLERHIAHRVRLRREAREDARAYRACGLGPTSWLIAALCARREYAIELTDREIGAIACVTWGALGDRRHHEEAV